MFFSASIEERVLCVVLDWIGLVGWFLCVKRCDGDVWPEWNDGGDGDWPGPAKARLLWNEWFWRFGGIA